MAGVTALIPRALVMPAKSQDGAGGPPGGPPPSGPLPGMPPAKCPRLEASAPDNDVSNVVHMAVPGKVDSQHHADAPDKCGKWHCYIYEQPWRGFHYLETSAEVEALQVDTPDQNIYVYKAEIDVYEDEGDSDDSDAEEEVWGIIYTSTLVTILKPNAVLSWRPRRRVRPREGC